MHNDPSSLEEELRRSMRRIEAPNGFADAVLRRIEHETCGEHVAVRRIKPEQPDKLASISSRAFYRLAAVLLLMLLIPFGDSLYQRHRQAQAEKAARQFELAMRLTHAALVDAGQQVFDHSRTHSTD